MKPIICLSVTLITLFCFIVGCRPNKNEQAISKAVTSLALTNISVNGQEWQFAVLSNKIAVRATDSNLMVFFSGGADFNIQFDPETTRPKSILFQLADSAGVVEQAIFDRNADGMPDAREVVATGVKEILYKGAWHKVIKAGKDTTIISNGKETIVKYDGVGWVEK